MRPTFHIVSAFATADDANRALEAFEVEHERMRQEWAIENEASGGHTRTPAHVDWFGFYDFPVDEQYRLGVLVAQHASAWDRLVFISAQNTSVRPDVLVSFLTRQGGTTYYEYHYDDDYTQVVWVDLVCSTPDQATMDMLFRELDTYFGYPYRPHYRYRPEVSVPWLVDVDITPWLKHLRDQAMAERSCRYDHEARGEVTYDQSRLTMRVRFNHIFAGLPALGRYLTRHGCTDISYHIAQAEAGKAREVGWEATWDTGDYACVAGVFNTPETAQAVAETLRHEHADDDVDPPRFPVEQWDRLVLCAREMDEWWYKEELRLLKQLGALTYTDVYYNDLPQACARVTVVCDGDPLRVTALASRIRDYLALPLSERAHRAPPWGTSVADGAEGSLYLDAGRLQLQLDLFRLPAGLPALVHYLQEHVSNHVQYRFVQIYGGMEAQNG